jgi:hypothetical protein
MHVVPKSFSWSSLWINGWNIKQPFPINPTNPCGMHLDLQMLLEQCRVKEKIITCDNVILVFIPSCMFNILMTCATINFHFMHIGFDISQTLDHHYITTQIWIFKTINEMPSSFTYLTTIYAHTKRPPWTTQIN